MARKIDHTRRVYDSFAELSADEQVDTLCNLLVDLPSDMQALIIRFTATWKRSKDFWQRREAARLAGGKP